MLPEVDGHQQLILISATKALYQEPNDSSDSDSSLVEEINHDTHDDNLFASNLEDNDADAPLCHLENFTASLEDNNVENSETFDKKDADCCRIMESLKEKEIVEELDSPKEADTKKSRKRPTSSSVVIDERRESPALEVPDIHRDPKRLTLSNTDEKQNIETNPRRSERLLKVQKKPERPTCSQLLVERQQNTSTFSKKCRRSQAETVSSASPKNTNVSNRKSLKITQTVVVNSLKRGRPSEVSDTRTEASNRQKNEKESVFSMSSDDEKSDIRIEASNSGGNGRSSMRLRRRNGRESVLSVFPVDKNQADIVTPKIILTKLIIPGNSDTPTSTGLWKIQSDSVNTPTERPRGRPRLYDTRNKSSRYSRKLSPTGAEDSVKESTPTRRLRGRPNLQDPTNKSSRCSQKLSPAGADDSVNESTPTKRLRGRSRLHDTMIKSRCSRKLSPMRAEDSVNESTPTKRLRGRPSLHDTMNKSSRCSRKLSPTKAEDISDDCEPSASDSEGYKFSSSDWEDDESTFSDSDDHDFVPVRTSRSTHRATPRTPHTQKNNVGTPTTPRTPRLRVNSLLPSLPSRSSRLSTPTTPKDRAMVALHISSIPENASSIPESLPCRQPEYDNIYKFLTRKIKGTDGGFMYVYGIPGAGKTATVERVVKRLLIESSKKKINKFKFVEINGMHLKRPKDAYCQIWKRLKNESASANTARRLLEEEFRTTFKKKSMLLLIDEFDMLFNRTLSVIDPILDWVDQSKLIVIGIANSKDLIEEINKSSTKSRLLRERLCDVQFKTYTYQQLQKIIEHRLQKNNVFTKEAVELLARKSALSGDVRLALNLCRRVLLEAGDIGTKEVVGPLRVMELLDKINKDPKIEFIKHLSTQERVLLRAIRDAILSSGLPTCSLEKNLYEHYKTLCILDGVTCKDAFSLFRMLRLLQTYAIITLSEFPSIHTDISLGSNLDLIQIAFPPQMRE